MPRSIGSSARAAAPSAAGSTVFKNQQNMPKSKASGRRAEKLAKRARRAAPQQPQVNAYADMVAGLRAALTERFYQERGFPHLEVLAERYQGPVTQGDLSDYLELLNLFESVAWMTADGLRRDSRSSMIEREDRIAGAAYLLAATLLNLRSDFRDVSGWMGEGVLSAIRERWGTAKMEAAQIDLSNRFMDPRDLASYFAMDYVFTLVDMTETLARMDEPVISVTACKDYVIAKYAGFATSKLTMAGAALPDLEALYQENAVTPEFLEQYPDWRPEAPDALNLNVIGFNSLSAQDHEFLVQCLSNERFMHDMRVLYTAPGNQDIAQGKREEIVMGYALRDGSRCRKAFAEGRDPTEEEMDRDAEVINLIAQQMIAAGGIVLPEDTEDSNGAYQFGVIEAGRKVYAANESVADEATVREMIKASSMMQAAHAAGAASVNRIQATVDEWVRASRDESAASPKKDESGH